MTLSILYQKLFCRRPKVNRLEETVEETVAPLTEIRSGQKWVLEGRYLSDGSPWPLKQINSITILDYKDGWVRYDCGSRPFNDERMEEDRFRSIYTLYPEKE